MSISSLFLASETLIETHNPPSVAGRLQSKFEKVIYRLRRRCGKHSTLGRGNMHTAVWLEYLWVGQRLVIVVWIEACKLCVWPLRLWLHLILQHRNVCCADLQWIYIFILYLLRIFCQTGIIIVHIPLLGACFFLEEFCVHEFVHLVLRLNS